MLKLHFRNCKRCGVFQQCQLEKSPFLNSYHTAVPEISPAFSIAQAGNPGMSHVTPSLESEQGVSAG